MAAEKKEKKQLSVPSGKLRLYEALVANMSRNPRPRTEEDPMHAPALRRALAALLLTATAAAHPLAAVPTFVDRDFDGLSDAFEDQLVQRFFPNLWLSSLEDRHAFYGCSILDPYAKIPYMVEPVWFDAGSTTGFACLYPGDCLLLKVGLPYDHDFGADLFVISLGGHLGDSEFYYALLSRVSFDRSIVKNNASGQTCTAELAKTDPTCWWIMVDWTSAHQDTYGDMSRQSVLSPFTWTIGASGAATVYSASRKHSNYHLDAECDSASPTGVPFLTDDCNPIYNVRDVCSLTFQNIGNSLPLGGNGHGDGYSTLIRYPASSTQQYDLWSNEPFGEASAYTSKFQLDGSFLWSSWASCVFTMDPLQKLAYCGRFDIQCQSDSPCTCNSACSPNVASPACGNGVCGAGESCSTCPADCGACPVTPVCGNGLCESGESCSSCAGDCGTCAGQPVCGDGICQSSESCQSAGGPGQCQVDCGCCDGWQPVCLAEGTPVALADGRSKSIEQVAAGDEVLAWDEATAKVVAARVSRTFLHTGVHKSQVAINHVLFATANHPFYVKGRPKPVPAGELRLGDQLMVLESPQAGVGSDLGNLKVQSLEELPAAPTVYNLEIEGPHNYFAGGVLVHNKSASAGCQGGGEPF